MKRHCTCGLLQAIGFGIGAASEKREGGGFGENGGIDFEGGRPTGVLREQIDKRIALFVPQLGDLPPVMSACLPNFFLYD